MRDNSQHNGTPRRLLRLCVTGVAALVGSGFGINFIGSNVQEWAKANCQDQYLVKYAGPAMDRLAIVTQNWFLFLAGFVIGGAVLLWVDYLLRRRTDAARPKPKEAHLEIVENKLFRNTELPLDGKHYVNNTFENVTFIYNGGPYRLEHNAISGIVFKSDIPEINAMVETLFHLGFLKMPAIIKNNQLVQPTNPIPL